MVNACVQSVLNIVSGETYNLKKVSASKVKVEEPQIFKKVILSIGRDVCALMLVVAGMEVWTQP